MGNFRQIKYWLLHPSLWSLAINLVPPARFCRTCLRRFDANLRFGLAAQLQKRAVRKTLVLTLHRSSLASFFGAVPPTVLQQFPSDWFLTSVYRQL